MILKRQQELGILKAASIPRKEGGSSISASLNTLSLSTLKDKATGWAFFLLLCLLRLSAHSTKSQVDIKLQEPLRYSNEIQKCSFASGYTNHTMQVSGT